MEKICKETAEEQFKSICEELCIDHDQFDSDDGDSGSKKKIISAIMQGRIEYEDMAFKLNLLAPIAGASEIRVITIREPDGNELRSMASVKKTGDDFGKAMAVLGAVTGHGLPVVCKMGSRDAMVAVAVLSLFL